MDDDSVLPAHACVAVEICWGAQRLRLTHVYPGQRFWLGDDVAGGVPLAPEQLGVDVLELVNARGEVSLVQDGVVLPPRALAPGEQLHMHCGQVRVGVGIALLPPPLRRPRARILLAGPWLPLLAAAATTACMAGASGPRAPLRADSPSDGDRAYIRARLVDTPPAAAPPALVPPPPQLAARTPSQGTPVVPSRARALPRPQIPHAPQATVPHPPRPNANRFGIEALLNEGSANTTADAWAEHVAADNTTMWDPGLDVAAHGLGLSKTSEGTLVPLNATPHWDGDYAFDYHAPRWRRRPPKPTINVRIRAVRVDGGLPGTVVARILYRGRAGYRQCYIQNVRATAPSDALMQTSFTIKANGLTTGTTVTGGELGAAMNACIRRVTSTLRFPEPAPSPRRYADVSFGISFSQ